MKTILLALLLTTSYAQAQADTDFTRVLEVEDYPCGYIITKTEQLTFLEATSDCRKQVLAKKDRPYYKDTLYNCTDNDKRYNRCKVPVPVSEPKPVLLLLVGFFFLGFGLVKRFYTHRLS
jgi:hypothetical protein